MRDAVAEVVHDGDVVAIEGFTHLICFAAGHEIIRQRKRDLTLARLTPDLIYDQMVAAGHGPQARVQLARQSRRRRAARHPPRVEDADPAPLELEEYSHFGMVGGTRPAPRTCRSSRCAPTSRRTCRRRTR
jgi:glutaconate CoA-transferase subunit A